MNSKWHVDFADLEIELRKSIKKDQVSERLGTYIMKIVKPLLATKQMLRIYNKEQIDRLEFECYDYIIRKLLVNYDTERRAGYAFIKSMALNRIRGTKRLIAARGLHPEVQLQEYNKRKKVKETYTFLTIEYIE